MKNDLNMTSIPREQGKTRKGTIGVSRKGQSKGNVDKELREKDLWRESQGHQGQGLIEEYPGKRIHPHLQTKGAWETPNDSQREQIKGSKPQKVISSEEDYQMTLPNNDPRGQAWETSDGS